MRYAVIVPNFDVFSDARTVAALARDAEDAGWDGFFVWDHLTFVKSWQLAIADPWILLTAVALATERIRLGPMVTPLPRRRPWKLARETTTLDRLSGGRLVLGVGLGAPPEDEYGSFDEPVDPATRAVMLDEGLTVLTRLWSGEPVTFHGKHYTVNDVAFRPTPAQQPRIPIWVAGRWPGSGPFRRAARWDGVFVIKRGGGDDLTPLDAADVRDLIALIRSHRTSEQPFDVAVGGVTAGDEPGVARDLLTPLREAGVTWWGEDISPRRGSLDELWRRVRLGPPPV